jgi:hypothetical protein
MRKLRLGLVLVALLVALGVAGAGADKIGQVSFVEGTASLVKENKEKALKVGAPIRAGDHLRTGADTQLEIRYANGSVIRIGEKSEVKLQGDETPEVLKGRLWSNIQKVAKGGTFQVKTPVATAAVRGTIFNVEVDSVKNAAGDSAKASAHVALYEGKVDVGVEKPGQGAGETGGWGAVSEVSGPKEVSMQEWISLDPGQMIDVNWDGSYSSGKIDEKIDAVDKWIRFNQERDKLVVRGQ